MSRVTRRSTVISTDDGSLAAAVRAAATGDQDAWDHLVERFSALVWNIARGHRLSAADAADVSQTVWLRLVESLPRLREPAAVAGWLATTARHESLRVVRRAGRELPDEDVEDTIDTAPSLDTTAESRLESAEQRDVVRRAVARLSIRCQSLLRALAYAPEGGYTEIAAALDMPIGSIGPTRGRCLDRLRTQLQDDPSRLFEGG